MLYVVLMIIQKQISVARVWCLGSCVKSVLIIHNLLFCITKPILFFLFLAIWVYCASIFICFFPIFFISVFTKVNIVDFLCLLYFENFKTCFSQALSRAFLMIYLALLSTCYHSALVLFIHTLRTDDHIHIVQ